jgi:signal transduction histidine kinase/CheY-like chemotaxis protein
MEREPRETEDSRASLQGNDSPSARAAIDDLPLHTFRVGTLLVVFFLALVARLPGHKLAPTLLALDLYGIGSGFLLFLITFAPLFSRRWRSMTFCVYCGWVISSTLTASIDHDVDLLTYKLVLLMTGAGALIPWELPWQGAYTALTFASLLVVERLNASDPGDATRWLVMVSAAAIAQYCVDLSTRHRRKIQQEAAQREAAILALKQTQRDLIAAREAALAASRAKSEFLSSMSHEIRTPMNVMLGMTDLLAETQLTKEQRRFVDRMTSNGNALLNLINSILDLARIESGKLSLERAEFDLEELVEDIADTLSVRAHEKGLELTARIPTDVPLRPVGDAQRLRQVLINLLGNAIKFTEQGEVALTVENEAGAGSEALLRFSVRDTGIGIAPDKLDAVFQSFTQADSGTTRKYGGSGLGLTIASRLVRMMGGRIQATSELGRGSTFSFVAGFGIAPPPLAAAQEPPDLAGIRTLVVDDNATNRLILRDRLTAQGAEVAEAAAGREAIEEAERARLSGRPYALVLLDFEMPEMDGVQVAAQLVWHTDAPPPVILMLRAEDLSRATESLSTLGIQTYVIKPVRRAELMRAIAVAIGRKSAEAERLHSTPSNGRTGQGVRPLRILLAEDSPDNRTLIEAYLKNLPYELDVAENGEIAVAKFIQGKHDVVLMDMQMPVMDGYDAVRTIRRWEREHGRPPTPVIALTASALQEDVRNAIAAGCTSHLSKPIKKSRLLSAMLDLTSRPTARSAKRLERLN